jgi:hypothetical protein
MVGFWMIFLDVGRVGSIDAMLRKSKRSAIELWPIKVMQLQIFLVYAVTFIRKAGTEMWRDGAALYYALQLDDANHWMFPWILQHKVLMSILSYAALLIELAIPLMVFTKNLRWIGIALGVCLHLGIDLMMQIRFFSIVMYFSYFTFVKPEEWRLTFNKLRTFLVRKTNFIFAH